MQNVLIVLFIFVTSHFSGIAQRFEWLNTVQNYSPTREHQLADSDSLGNYYLFTHTQSTYYFNNNVDSIEVVGIQDGIITKNDSDGNLIWLKQIKSLSNAIFIRSLSIDSDLNVYVTGYFSADVDFSLDGSGVQILTSNGGADSFVLKIDSSGNFVWVKQFGSSQAQLANLINVKHDGTLVFSGKFNDTIDADPGIGVFELINNSTLGNAFIICLDSNGNFLWAYAYPSITTSEIKSLTWEADSTLLISGEFRYPSDVAAGPSVVTCPINSAKELTGGLLRVDQSNGEYLSHSFNTGFSHVTKDSQDNFIVSGTTLGSMVNYYQMNGDTITPSLFPYSGFIAKLDNNFDLISTISIRNSEVFYSETDKSENVYSLLYVADSIFTAYTPIDTVIYELDNYNNFVLIKIDSLGQVKWLKDFNAVVPNESWRPSCKLLRNDAIMFSMFFDDTIVIPYLDNCGKFIPEYSGGGNLLLGKIRLDSCSHFELRYSGICDSTLYCLDSVKLVASHSPFSQLPIEYSWGTSNLASDSVYFQNQPGIIELVATDGFGCTLSKDFIIDNSMFQTNLNSNLVATSHRPGFSTSIWLDMYDNGCIPLDGSIKFVPDTLTNYISSIPSPDFIYGDTLIWILSGGIINIPIISLTTSLTAVIGDTVCHKLIVTSTVSGTSNTKEYCFPVINGYDPNDMHLFPSGKCEENYIDLKTPHVYTVRFQNTGNSQAINIFIVDTISSFLDLNTFKILGSSAEVEIEYLGGHVVKFRFDSINLPDSSSNEIGSQGYVIFQLMQKTNTPHGLVIDNMASIYFDFNPAIYTNTVLSTSYSSVASGLPLEQFDCFTDETIGGNINDYEILLYPNPSSSGGKLLIYLNAVDPSNGEVYLNIHSIDGKLVRKVFLPAKEGTYTLDNHLARGIYEVMLFQGSQVIQRDRLVIY